MSKSQKSLNNEMSLHNSSNMKVIESRIMQILTDKLPIIPKA